MYSMHKETNLNVFREVVLEFKPKTIIDIGTYYGGIAFELHKLLDNDGRIFAIQSVNEDILIHVPDTNRGAFSKGEAGGEIDPILKNQDWKAAVKKFFPEEYHGYFDFNLLVQTFQKMDKATLILDTSPMKYPWPFGYDLCILDISPTIDENIYQSEYWLRHGNKDGHLLVGAYKHREDYYNWITKTHKAIRRGEHHVLVCV